MIGTDSMTSTIAERYSRKNLVLLSMMFVVAMVFIDMTIVAIALPIIHGELNLSSTGAQWIVTGYMISMAALIAFGGRLGDIFGHVKLVTIGVLVFAFGSLMSGLTPIGPIAEPWIIGFRILQGIGGALMFPSAVMLVFQAYPIEERGRAMAKFFGFAGAFTALGPIAGGYLTEWTWRSIFWINIPVAILALVTMAIAKPPDVFKRAPLDLKGLVPLVGGMGLLILGLQQASRWTWSSPKTYGCIAAGLILLVVFVAIELRVANPIIRMQIFKNRMFAIDNVIMGLAFALFVPLVFFGSMYAQISLQWSADNAGLYILIWMGGYFVATQYGGKMMDQIGVKSPALLGTFVGTVGLILWAASASTPHLGGLQIAGLIVTGAGFGFIIAPVSTDAVNRAPQLSMGEATGITQTFRNFGSSLGMAVLGTILITVNTGRIESFLRHAGEPAAKAEALTQQLLDSSGGHSGAFSQIGGTSSQQIATALQNDFAAAIQVVLYVCAGVMAVTFLVALFGLKSGRQTKITPVPAEPPAPAT